MAPVLGGTLLLHGDQPLAFRLGQAGALPLDIDRATALQVGRTGAFILSYLGPTPLRFNDAGTFTLPLRVDHAPAFLRGGPGALLRLALVGRGFTPFEVATLASLLRGEFALTLDLSRGLRTLACLTLFGLDPLGSRLLFACTHLRVPTGSVARMHLFALALLHRARIRTRWRDRFVPAAGLHMRWLGTLRLRLVLAHLRVLLALLLQLRVFLLLVSRHHRARHGHGHGDADQADPQLRIHRLHFLHLIGRTGSMQAVSVAGA
ncbi:MAG TPA: hypothetical protein VGD21_08930 [Lysobacter sp.]